MELNELSKYKNTLFNIAVVMLTMLIAFNFIYKKQFKEISSLKEKKDREIKKNRLLSNISQLEKRINAYRSLLNQKDASSVINAVGDTARESGVKIISIRPGRQQIYSEYIKFPFDLVITTADYHTLGKFISKLESSQDVYMVDALSITSAAQAKELTANLKLSSIAFTD